MLNALEKLGGLPAAPSAECRVERAEGRVSSVRDWVIDHGFVPIFSPPDRRPIGDWAREKITLEVKQSADYAGQAYDIDNVPHARLIFDFFADPYAEEMHLLKSSAAAFSTAIFVACVHTLKFRPCNILYAINSLEEARRMSASVAQPFLRQVFGDALIEEDGQSNFRLQINGAWFYLGSYTEGFFRNKQVSICILDEYDLGPERMDEGKGEEPLAAARVRTRHSTFFRKILTLSAPLRRFDPERDKRLEQPGTKQHRAYLSGDQREFRARCLACGFEFVPHRSHFDYGHCVRGGQPPLASPDGAVITPARFDLDMVKRETFLRCPTCSAVYLERGSTFRPADGKPQFTKRALIETSRFIPTRPEAPRVRWSAQFSNVSILISSRTWGAIAADLIEAEGKNPAVLASILRNDCGEPEAPDLLTVDLTVSHLAKHCGTHARGFVPLTDPFLLVLTVDVQGGEVLKVYFKWGISAFREDGTQFVIDWGQIGDEKSPGSLMELRALLARAIPGAPAEFAKHPDGRWLRLGRSIPKDWPREMRATSHKCMRALIDSGDLATELIYPFCLSTYLPAEQRLEFVPCKGRGFGQIQHLTQTTVARHGDIEMPLELFNDNRFKSLLYNGILAADPANTSDKLGKMLPRIIFPRASETEEDFLREHCSERIVETVKRYATGQRLVRLWEVIGGQRNDWGDTSKMARVAFELVRSQAGRAAISGSPSADFRVVPFAAASGG